ncbi:Deoxyribonuclease-2-alpha [Trichinella pseudospiralis]|uniref:Deoxyribonuclease-2-alpha n=1 Tax=Trichinella pseudospiralis TaxID=6337 RepID=A0A0V1J7D1_TRIPS|nr:Deoxyribonuclease-2-alpha [Trichinella pseudospiralis]
MILVVKSIAGTIIDFELCSWNGNVARHNSSGRCTDHRSIVYKAPGQANGKIITAGDAGNWQDGAAAITADRGHSFAKALEHVVGNNDQIKFLAYNNVPPQVPKVKTKSNSKGVIILSTNADAAAWIVHTVPGFPIPKTAYTWPAAETAKGHLLLCLTISESQINGIAASLLFVQPIIHYNDIPETETAGMPYFRKLIKGEIPTLPPFTSRGSIRTENAGGPVTVHIYSKSETSKYEIYKKIIVRALKKTIKVWSRRDNKLKGDCRVSQRNIRLITSPASVSGHNTNLELDETSWAVSDPGSIFCHIDKPYFVSSKIKPKNHHWQFALKIMIYLPDLMQLLLNLIIVHDKILQLYKAPGQATGKIILAGAAASWDDGATPLTNAAGHSFGKTLEHVIGNNNAIKFLAYNNVPPQVPKVNTKSNSKGVIVLSTAGDAAAWIVHTVPGFPAAKTGYTWPVAENARGHLLICLTISESQINAIAASLLLVQPLVHYNDIPDTETAAMPYFNKLKEGRTPTLPPFTLKKSIRTESAAAPVAVQIYSKSESSKYVIVKALKKTIKVWSRRDNKLKGDCRVLQRNIRLIKSPAAINGHNTNLEADDTTWAVSDPGNTFCHVDKPYFKNQTKEPAMAICIENNDIFARFNEIAAQIEDCPKSIVYKAPGQANGKIIVAGAAGNWLDGAAAINAANGHSFAKALEHVVGINNQIKFLAYNNVPPRVPKVRTKSNSKGVIILSTNADAAAWIVHTVPGFPIPKTAYTWPAAETAKGHLLLCLTISESQINGIAASLLFVQPIIHYNDIPETETAGMPYFRKLIKGEIPTLPPFTSRGSIRTENAGGPVTVHIYSKSETSKYEIYKKIIVRALKKTIKVWSRRDNKLKGDCRVSQRNIRLITSPASVSGHNTNLELDETSWAVSDPGSIFCHIDKPYFKDQAKEPSLAVCIENNDIFARFDAIAAQLDNCP